MMSDVFVEHMVVRRPTAAVLVQKCLAALAAVAVAAISFWFLGGFGLLPASGAVWGILALFRRLDLEFEYIVTNGEMDVDKIMGRRSRKRLFTVDCRAFDILAPYKEEYLREIGPAATTNRIDVSGHPQSPGRWFAVYNAKEGARTLLIFEPNEKMLNAFSLYIRNKIKS
jgi:hypothetical protein